MTISLIPRLSPTDCAYFPPHHQPVRGASHNLSCMALRLSYCPFRLEFKHPFGTAHGVRTGTDSVFVKLEGEGITGYGEVTLPPYLKEKPAEVIRNLKRLGAAGPLTPERLQAILDDPAWFGPESPGCRAAVHMALSDWIATKKEVTVRQLLDIPNLMRPLTLVTLGITQETEVATKLAELPASGAIKLKVQDETSARTIRMIRELDARPIFLDANQGLSGVAEAMNLAQAAGDRLLAMEQPFPVTEKDWQAELLQLLGTTVYGDESIQNLHELDREYETFNGVNIKLMKCGGLDRAKAMAERAVELGMKVMLGSMSESSLGCTAMAQLSGYADIVDLDGPILIKNDPFEGMVMRIGEPFLPDRPGIGAVLVGDLPFQPVRG